MNVDGSFILRSLNINSFNKVWNVCKRRKMPKLIKTPLSNMSTKKVFSFFFYFKDDGHVRRMRRWGEASLAKSSYPELLKGPSMREENSEDGEVSTSGCWNCGKHYLFTSVCIIGFDINIKVRKDKSAGKLSFCPHIVSLFNSLVFIWYGLPDISSREGCW